MVSEKMYGVFEYQGKEYPFVLEKQILTIPQIPFQYGDDFKDETYIEEIRGLRTTIEVWFLLAAKF